MLSDYLVIYLPMPAVVLVASSKTPAGQGTGTQQIYDRKQKQKLEGGKKRKTERKKKKLLKNLKLRNPLP